MNFRISRMDREMAAEEAFLVHHCMPQLMEQLTFEILRCRPVDHVAFTRRWLSNLHDKMKSLGQQTIEGIDLTLIDGNVFQHFAGQNPLSVFVDYIAPTFSTSKQVTPSSKGSEGNSLNTGAVKQSRSQRARIAELAECLSHEDAEKCIKFMEGLMPASAAETNIHTIAEQSLPSLPSIHEALERDQQKNNS